MADDRHLLVGDNGEPLGVVDMTALTTAGVDFAFELAACCDDPDAVAEVQANVLASVGSEAFGYVVASALSTMTKEILAPTFEIVREATGHDPQIAMRDIAAGIDPMTGKPLRGGDDG